MPEFGCSRKRRSTSRATSRALSPARAKRTKNSLVFGVSDRRTGGHVNRNETHVTATGWPFPARPGYARRVKQELEREVKLAPDEGFVLPELGGEPLPTRRFTSTYHDTPDLVLARHGVTLRHRVEAGTGVWQLKLPRGWRPGSSWSSPVVPRGRRSSSRRCSSAFSAAASWGRSRASARGGRACERAVPRSSTTRFPCSPARR